LPDEVNDGLDVCDLEHGVRGRFEEDHRDVILSLYEERLESIGMSGIDVMNFLLIGTGRAEWSNRDSATASKAEEKRGGKQAVTAERGKDRKRKGTTYDASLRSEPAEESVRTTVEIVSRQKGLSRLDEPKDEVESGHARGDDVGRGSTGDLLQVVL
jgi:hypothetical protein